MENVHRQANKGSAVLERFMSIHCRVSWYEPALICEIGVLKTGGDLSTTLP